MAQMKIRQTIRHNRRAYKPGDEEQLQKDASPELLVSLKKRKLISGDIKATVTTEGGDAGAEDKQ